MADELEKQYKERYEKVLTIIADKLEDHIKDLVKDVPRIDRVSARAKSITRFLAKAHKIEGNKNKYDEPLSQIQDQIGARIIVYYKSDVPERTVEIKDIPVF